MAYGGGWLRERSCRPDDLASPPPFFKLFRNLYNMKIAVSVLLFYGVSGVQGLHHEAGARGNPARSWILNQPLIFQSKHAMAIVDAKSDSLVMAQTEAIIDLYRTGHERGGDSFTNNEIVDAIGNFRISHLMSSRYAFLHYLYKI